MNEWMKFTIIIENKKRMCAPLVGWLILNLLYSSTRMHSYTHPTRVHAIINMNVVLIEN